MKVFVDFESLLFEKKMCEEEDIEMEVFERDLMLFVLAVPIPLFFFFFF
jgi:hypothetical protein